MINTPHFPQCKTKTLHWPFKFVHFWPVIVVVCSIARGRRLFTLTVKGNLHNTIIKVSDLSVSAVKFNIDNQSQANISDDSQISFRQMGPETYYNSCLSKRFNKKMFKNMTQLSSTQCMHFSIKWHITLNQFIPPEPTPGWNSHAESEFYIALTLFHRSEVN